MGGVGCSSVGTGTFNYLSDDRIPANIRVEAAKERDALLAAARAGNREAFTMALAAPAKAQIEAGVGLDRFISATKEMIAGVMSVEEEHYIRGTSAGVFNPVLVVSEGEAHTFVLPQLSGEAYLFLLAFDQGHRQTAVGLVFSKEAAAWKLSTAYVGGMFSVGGRTARGWFDDARTLSSKDDIVAAALRLVAAAKCLRPIPTMQFGFESDLQEFGRSLQARLAASFPLPMRLTEIEGTPEIMRLDASFGKGILVPTIDLLTTTPLTDMAQLENEAARIDKVLPSRLPGLCTGVQIYMLKAFNENPSEPKRRYSFHGLQRTCR